MKIRKEQPDDVPSIQTLTKTAFPSHLEATILETLRNSSALTLSLVVTDNSNRTIGHVAFSPVEIANTSNWVGLGPISVDPAVQRQGIGSLLIREGLRQLRDTDVNGCVLLGNPDYYKRFGFENTNLTYAGVDDQQYFLSVTFRGETPEGDVKYHEAFDV